MTLHEHLSPDDVDSAMRAVADLLAPSATSASSTVTSWAR